MGIDPVILGRARARLTLGAALLAIACAMFSAVPVAAFALDFTTAGVGTPLAPSRRSNSPGGPWTLPGFLPQTSGSAADVFAPMVDAGGVHTVGLKSDGTALAAAERGPPVQRLGVDRNRLGFGRQSVHCRPEVGRLGCGHWLQPVSPVQCRRLERHRRRLCRRIPHRWPQAGRLCCHHWLQHLRTVQRRRLERCHDGFRGVRPKVGLKADGTVLATGNNVSGQCNTSGWTGIVAVSAGRTTRWESDPMVRCSRSGWRPTVGAISRDGAHWPSRGAEITVSVCGATAPS